MRIIPTEITPAQLYPYLTSAIAPRPICFASTIDAEGKPNLSPFSFFNVFGSRPPLLVFAPLRRMRDNTNKHTFENIQATGEVVINVVNYDMVQQVNLASCEYPIGTDEFSKAGFTPLKSELVKPFRVKESPVQIECKVLQVIETGTEGGAGNLILCEAVCMHINDEILDENNQIDPHKIDLVARMGGDHYCRASGSSVFSVPKPNQRLGVGIDALPEHIRTSTVLTGNHLGLLGNCDAIPIVSELPTDDRLFQILREYKGDEAGKIHALHVYAAELLNRKDVDYAWQILLSGEEESEQTYLG